MAYSNLLASVSEKQVAALKENPTTTIKPAQVVTISHLIAYWVQLQPLGKILGQAIDGGESLSPELSHPLRPPTFHTPAQTKDIASQLASNWSQALATHPVAEDDWYRIEIEKVLAVFQHAAVQNHCIISVLMPPLDAQRADQVHIPIQL